MCSHEEGMKLRIGVDIIIQIKARTHCSEKHSTHIPLLETLESHTSTSIRWQTALDCSITTTTSWHTSIHSATYYCQLASLDSSNYYYYLTSFH